MFNFTDELLARLEKAHGIAYLAAVSGAAAGPILAIAKMKPELLTNLDLSKLLLLVFAIGAPVLLVATVAFLLADAIGAAGGKFDLHASAPAALAAGGVLALALHAIAIVFSEGSITGYGLQLAKFTSLAVAGLCIAGLAERTGKKRKARTSPAKEWRILP